MVFKDFCVLVIWAKLASALEGLTPNPFASGVHSRSENFESTSDNYMYLINLNNA